MTLSKYPSVKEAILYERLADGVVRCDVCGRRCIIPKGRMGFCKTRINQDGKLYTLVYGDINALDSRSIEIKPFFHFYPGSTSLTFSTWSCNFTCAWCQNHHLSKKAPDPKRANYISADEMVNIALERKNEGICVSFTEPTMLFEYSLDVFKLAKKKGLYNCYVSNGYLTSDALLMLKEAGMDAINIDIKGDADVYKRYCGNVDVDIVWKNAKKALELDIHIEMVNLVITGVNDDENSLMQLISRHIKNVGCETPLHFTRYFPAFRFKNPPTDVKTLEDAYRMAKDAGILYPYLGNVPGHEYENTYCPSCDKLLVERWAFRILYWNITEDMRCPRCGFSINIKGRYVVK